MVRHTPIVFDIPAKVVRKPDGLAVRIVLRTEDVRDLAVFDSDRLIVEDSDGNLVSVTLQRNPSTKQYFARLPTNVVGDTVKVRRPGGSL